MSGKRRKRSGANGRAARSAAKAVKAEKRARAAQEIAPEVGWHAFLPAIVVVAGIAVYWSGFDGAFVLDDDQHIVKNANIKGGSLGDLLGVRRPVVELSLALNHALHGLDVWGYHVLNLVVHLLAGLTLFGIVRRTLQLPALAARYARVAPWLALATSVLWVVHPLQTQSVTYVIQRGESMMGLCYLLTLYCLIRSAGEREARKWIIAAIAAAAVGMGAKAIIITAPALLLLYDRIFLARSFAEIWQRRWALHVGVIAAIVTVGVATSVVPSVVDSATRSDRTDSVRLSLGRAQSPMEYYATQPEVVLHYIRLAYWPRLLVLDYKWPPIEEWSRAVVPGVCLLALLGLTVWALLRAPPLGFLGAWFFVILAPTCYLWTLELAFEHRMYLSLAALVLGTVLVAHAGLRRAMGPGGGVRAAVVGSALLLTATLALGYRTTLRNRDYESAVTLYRAAAVARPGNDRAHYNLGNHLRREGRKLEAIEPYEHAVGLNPRHLGARINLALTYLDVGRYEDAIVQYRSVLEMKPRHAIGLGNAGNALLLRGEQLSDQGAHREARDVFMEALSVYQRSLEVRPQHYRSMTGVGYAHHELGEYLDAEQALRRAIAKNSRDARALRTLGHALSEQGLYDEAEQYLRRSLDLEPQNPAAQRWLGAVERAREAGS